MTSTESELPSAEAPRRRPRWRWLVFGALGVVVAVVGIGVLLVGLFVAGHVTRATPSFPSLLDQPDPSVHGTVAYVDGDSCVSVVPAGGGDSKQVLCLPPLDPSKVEQEGKPLGPQLVWLADGRLEVTMINQDISKAKAGGSPDLRPSWQKIVDVRTGTVTDVPTAEVPNELNLGTRPTTSPTGERVSFTSDRQNGHISITLTDAAGTSRTLLVADGPGEYTYGLRTVFWAPDYASVVADDGRILIITVDEPSVTRQLVDNANLFGEQPDQAGFAVTSQNLLAPA